MKQIPISQFCHFLGGNTFKRKKLFRHELSGQKVNASSFFKCIVKSDICSTWRLRNQLGKMFATQGSCRRINEIYYFGNANKIVQPYGLEQIPIRIGQKTPLLQYSQTSSFGLTADLTDVMLLWEAQVIHQHRPNPQSFYWANL